LDRSIIIEGKLCTVVAYQRSKTVWIASGDYLGQRIEMRGSSANSAVKRWADAARKIDSA